MFPPRKSLGPLISTSCDRPGLRLFILVCLFSLTMSAFWWNFERRIGDLKPEKKIQTIINDDGILTEESLLNFNIWREKFSKTWNIPLILQASAQELKLPPYPINSLYVGIGLKHHEAVIAVPPLVGKILGEGKRLQTEEGLSACLKKDSPIICLDKSLQSIWTSLGQ